MKKLFLYVAGGALVVFLCLLLATVFSSPRLSAVRLDHRRTKMRMDTTEIVSEIDTTLTSN